MKQLLTATAVIITIIVLIAVAISMSGSGGWKRKITLSGIYAVCKPEGYPVVCFLDADGKDGGAFCMPINEAGGKCL